MHIHIKRKYGFSMLEMSAVILIFSLLLFPSIAYFRTYHRALVLDSTAAKIVEAVGLAREYALNERRECYVSFSDTGFKVIRQDGKPVGRPQRFPEGIIVKKKSAGFDPAVLKPDGTAKMAGRLKLGHISHDGEITIVLYNLTGRCFVQK